MNWKALTVVMIVMLPVVLLSQVPRTLNYQGKVTDDSGVALTGAYTIKFNIYNAGTGGSPLWTETQDVEIVNGLFDVQLGSINPINLAFTEQYWMELHISSDAGSTWEIFDPREKLSSTSYSFRSVYSDTAAYAEVGSGGGGGLTEDDFKLGTEGQPSMMRRLVSSCSELPTSGEFSWTEVTHGNGYDFCISPAMDREPWYGAADICNDLGGRICSTKEYYRFYGQTSTSVNGYWTNSLRTTGTSDWKAIMCYSNDCSSYYQHEYLYNWKLYRCCVIIGN